MEGAERRDPTKFRIFSSNADLYGLQGVAGSCECGRRQFALGVPIAP